MTTQTKKTSGGLSLFERYLTLWVALCIAGGIVLGKLAPNFAKSLDGMSIDVGGAPSSLSPSQYACSS
ncbi:MAG TPA: hypothetical protein PKB02_14230 [Anaerohalosphaeraceae bacterium]|nr:hypothetical protein [Anaerohalosphaeraceae bacterium]